MGSLRVPTRRGRCLHSCPGPAPQGELCLGSAQARLSPVGVAATVLFLHSLSRCVRDPWSVLGQAVSTD